MKNVRGSVGLAPAALSEDFVEACKAATGSRLRADGSIVPRNSFVGQAIHRVDIRVSKTFPLAGRAKIEGFADSFNLFNHENYNPYTLVETSPLYGHGADGSLARHEVFLRADATGYVTFPTAPRVALPIDMSNASGEPLHLETSATDIGMIDLPNSAAGPRDHLGRQDVADAQLLAEADQQGVEPGGVGDGQLGDVPDPHQHLGGRVPGAHLDVPFERGGGSSAPGEGSGQAEHAGEQRGPGIDGPAGHHRSHGDQYLLAPGPARAGSLPPEAGSRNPSGAL